MNKTENWALYICRACGLIYDESKGDEDSGLAAGTRFEDIPEDWACPLCGVTKADFELYTDALATESQQSVRASRAASRATSRAGGGSSARGAGTVIVGAGRAGWLVAQALRQLDAHHPITIVTVCNGDVYDKPTLSVAMAKGMGLDELVREQGAAAATRLNVKLLAHTHAVRITPQSRQLRTSRGTLRYQHLVLAHGASARQIPQCDPQLCWYINHLQVYAKFRASLGLGPQRVAVVGAGLIGCELANDLALAGHSVTLIDVAERPLAATLAAEQSLALLNAWQKLPINFIGKVQIKRVKTSSSGEKGEKNVLTECGQSIEVDQVVVAAGLQTPNLLAISAGLAWNNGIDVNPTTLATTVRGVYALGDCISIGGNVTRFIEPIARQAQTITAQILGKQAVPFVYRQTPLRIKTSSLPFTVGL